MREANLEPDSISYTVGISACGKRAAMAVGELGSGAADEPWQRALALLSEMREAKLEPNVMREGRPLAAGARATQRDAGGDYNSGLRRAKGVRRSRDAPERPPRAPRRFQTAPENPYVAPRRPQAAPLPLRDARDGGRTSQEKPN
ncbi:unnamed protein product [Prorocentrum cordatum]|uniref:RNA helicase n=1 Tax=Prorocentrum cordatum TaxID=2364126 RepID=A0ABN9QJY7_9DINO|nr:unnamed protein product [Polarella glacialis]